MRTGRTRHRGRTWPLLIAAVLVSALAFSAACGGCGCAAETVESPTTAVDQAKDLSAKANVMAIAAAVRSHIAMTGEAPAEASQATLGSFLSPWPENPYTKAPMQPGDAPGDYVYRRLGGDAYELSVHLSDGTLSPAP